MESPNHKGKIKQDPNQQKKNFKNSENKIGFSQKTILCGKYGRNHQGECRSGTDVCYRWGEMGHMCRYFMIHSKLCFGCNQFRHVKSKCLNKSSKLVRAPTIIVGGSYMRARGSWKPHSLMLGLSSLLLGMVQLHPIWCQVFFLSYFNAFSINFSPLFRLIQNIRYLPCKLYSCPRNYQLSGKSFIYVSCFCKDFSIPKGCFRSPLVVQIGDDRETNVFQVSKNYILEISSVRFSIDFNHVPSWSEKYVKKLV